MLPLKRTERWYIAGSTGSGKSTFARAIAAAIPWGLPIVVFDTKGDFIEKQESASFADGKGKIKGLKAGELLRLKPKPGERERENFDAIFKEIYARKNCAVVIDELFQVDSEVLDDVLTTGRSLHIPVVACSQRPAWHTRFMLSEASRISVFKLTDPQDRKRLRGFIGPEVEEELPNHYQWYRDLNTDDEPQILGPCLFTDDIVRVKPVRAPNPPPLPGLILWA
ncbi:MAG: helicase HerA domain-containing protein [Acidobacteriaceae bacterium]